MKFYQSYNQAINAALSGGEVHDGSGELISQEVAIESFCQLLRPIAEAGGRQFFCGNGASAAFANHMALDWSKNGGVTSMSFSESAILTALVNDNGADSVFADPLKWYAKSGDLLVTISSSGNSPNIVRAIEVAREIGMKVVTLSGLKPGNRSRTMGDLNFYVPAKTYGIVECAHQVILHAMLDCHMGIEEWDRDGFQNMRIDDFSL